MAIKGEARFFLSTRRKMLTAQPIPSNLLVPATNGEILRGDEGFPASTGLISATSQLGTMEIKVLRRRCGG